MLKTYLFIILVMLTRPALSASLMSHEKFVHLNYDEQKQIVIATMELVVEMESKYKHEVKTSGFNPERFRRYTEFMKKVSSLLFPEAYAAPAKNQRYGQYLNELTTILNQRNRCIYGGWISEMRGNKCTHPLNTQFRNIYQTEGGCTGNSNQITCNPAIFGFKNVGQKTLFCVPAGINQADNTSRDCMVKALANPAEAGASTREQRIANMIEGIGRNPNDANAIFDFLIKACACDARTSPQISQQYADYMRPHQTCYSILKMMSEVTPQCQVNNQPLMDANQTQFLTAIRGILSETEMKSNDVRQSYITKLGDLRANNAEFRASEVALCGSSPQTPVVTGGSTTTTTCDENKKLSNGTCCEDGKIPNATKAECIPDGSGDGDDNGEIVVTGQRPVPDTTTTTPGTTTTTPEITPDTTTTTPEVTPGTTVTPETTTPTACTPPDPAKEFVGGQCRPKCVAPTPERDPVTFECKAATEETPDDETPDEDGITINLTATNKDVNTAKITVTITPESTDKTQYTIIWFSRGSNRPTTFPGSTPRTTTPDAGLIEDTPEATATTPEGSTSETDPEPATTTTTTTTTPDTSRNPGDNENDLNRDNFWGPLDAPRQSNDYEVCARLIKGTEKVSEDCEKVPMKPTVAPRRNSGGNPMMQPQMGPTRGGPSDAIFRGVR